MKTRSFAIDLLLLASILLSTSCAAPTPVASPTSPATQTLSPTATQTTVPTETLTPTETPVPAEFIEINIIEGGSAEFKDIQTGITTTLSVDQSMTMRPNDIANNDQERVDQIIPNPSFREDPDKAMADFTQHLYFKTIIATNEKANGVTFEEYQKYLNEVQSGDMTHRDMVEFTIFDDATNKMVTIIPTNLEVVFGTSSQLKGLQKPYKDYDDGYRTEYTDNKIRFIFALSNTGKDITSFGLSNALSQIKEWWTMYKGQPINVHSMTDAELKSYLTSKNGLSLFKIMYKGNASSTTEFQHNP